MVDWIVKCCLLVSTQVLQAALFPGQQSEAEAEFKGMDSLLFNLCKCVFVSVCVCVYVCMFLSICICLCACIRRRSLFNLFHVQICMYILFIFVYTFIHLCVYWFARLFLCLQLYKINISLTIAMSMWRNPRKKIF